MPFRSYNSNETHANQLGIISVNVNIDWFMKIAEEEGYVIITEFEEELLGPHKFWAICEEKITTVLEDGTIELHGEYAHECLENAVFSCGLMDDPEFMDEFNKYFISKDHFDWIEEMTDQMADLTTGDELATSGLGLGVPTVLIEKLHDGRWGVKTLEDKAVIREHAGDWFVNQRVVLIAEYPHVQAEEDFKRVATEMTGGKAKISVNF